MFQPFHISLGPHQSILSGVGVDGHQKDLAILLFEQLACHSKVGSSLAGTSQALDYKILGCGGQVPPSDISAHEDMTADSKLHGLTGTVVFPGAGPSCIPSNGN